MKSISLILLGLILSFYSNANIINGYESEVKKAEDALLNLSGLLENAKLTNADEQFYRIKSHYLRAKQTLKHANNYYTLTEDLINRLRQMHGSFYNELNDIRNFHGLVTDVYISVMPESLMKLSQFGTTNVDQVESDPHTYQSSFGPNTVSIQVRHCSERKMTNLLVHELAHVKYQVPNLLSYLKYYRQAYQGFEETDSFGHLKDDPSNQSVVNEMNAFNAIIKRKPTKDLIAAADRRNMGARN